ncbi:hypothetical protein [Bacillus dakarensis]|uniref:hypothetical protein n=1 Tax=Robertmurraya dakarensis TaxID=1926278 RepID=UPI000A065ACD|nr:hypothetical protein [Bacillus dakarensis]
MDGKIYRSLSFIIIFSFVTVMLYLHNQSSHITGTNHLTAHAQPYEVPDTYPIPTINGSVIQDQSGSWLLKIKTENFQFTPEKIGSTDIKYNEGHAHLFINGKKVNRIYGQYYNLDYLKPGTYEVKVTLNTNDHRFLSINGEIVSFTETIKVAKEE